jgi:hypothetical protein
MGRVRRDYANRKKVLQIPNIRQSRTFPSSLLFTCPMQKLRIRNRIIFFVFAALGAAFVSSCKENVSAVGSKFLHDTVSSGTHAFSDSATFAFTPVVRRTITASGLSYSINRAAATLFFGKVTSQNLEIWSAMKMPILPDSVGRILTDTLQLRMRFAYQYGDPNDQNISFSIYAETGNKVNDSTSSLSLSDLNMAIGNAGIIGSYTGAKANDSLLTISIPLDTAAVNPFLRTASLALVIVPNASMNTVRAFASIDNGDNTFSPQLRMQINTPSDTIIRYPINDFHLIVSDGFQPSGGEFALRGSYAKREHIVINIKHIRDMLGLNPFVTINSALFEVRSDVALHTTSNVPLDTAGPILYIPNIPVFDSVLVGTSSRTDTTLYGFQIRSSIEQALRTGSDSIVLELRSDFINRSFNSTVVSVEDQNINRWVIYGIDTANPALRPKLVIAYSFLR